ncbi:MAG TPA: hypothetical protein VMV72_14340 [Verrucomicrobiae bacterium]|nr:hypothetical protein [Verrucomicrobiae bacterium]
MEDIHDIKGLVPVPYGWWWLWLLLAFAVAAVALWLSKRKGPGAPAVVVPPPTPYEVAIRELRRLREENPPVEEFYTRLSDIVRQYLEGQMGLRAPERTTEEFLYEVSRDHSLSAEHRELLGAFLQEADLVKFARHQPGAEDRQRALAAAEKFVEDTQPRAQEVLATA